MDLFLLLFSTVVLCFFGHQLYKAATRWAYAYKFEYEVDKEISERVKKKYGLWVTEFKMYRLKRGPNEYEVGLEIQEGPMLFGNGRRYSLNREEAKKLISMLEEAL